MAENPPMPEEALADYVGLNGESAEARARAEGWRNVRMLAPDSYYTSDYVVDRLNLVVADEGRVVQAWLG